MLTNPSKNQPQTVMGTLKNELKAHGSSNPHAASALPLSLSRYTPVAAKTQEQKVEKQVRNWVGETFYGTMLKQMRDDPFKSKIFDGGRGGEAFGQMFDQRLAQHMAGGVGSKIVRPMVKQMLGNAAKRASEQYDRQSKSSQEHADVRTDRRA